MEPFLDQLLADLLRVGLAFALALPIGWERGKGRNSVGFRTLPIVAMAACGFTLVIRFDDPRAAEAQARILQGVITGIGFIGGGAILKEGQTVRGLVTAASIWNAGAIGAAAGLGRVHVAVILSAVNFLALLILDRFQRDSGDRAE